MSRHLITLLFAVSAVAPVFAANPQKNANVTDLKYSIVDSEIVYPESFETDTRKLLEGWYMKNYTATDERYSQLGDVETADDEIKKRLAALPTAIELPFNSIVRNYIDRYTRRGRSQVAGILGLANYYLPIFEQALEAEKLPLELKYLPVIESGLDPNAVSRHGATGLWQFMIATANGLGLEVNSLVDERRDPYASSKAAALYLKTLYEAYGDWTLAIAAYNCGPGSVNKAIRRAGGDPKSHDFWSIYEYLSPETRGYVPMFIAANYVMNYYDKHNISPVLPTKPLVTDTVGISDRIHFNQISAILDIPVEELRILNPQYRTDLIPGSGEKVYMLTLPGQQIQAYILSQDEILAYDADKYARRETVNPGDSNSPEDIVVDENDVYAESIPEEELFSAPHPASVVEIADPVPVAGRPAASGKKQTVTHTVAQGETLASIAARYDVDVAAIKAENGLRRSAVRAGQQLKITTAKTDLAQADPAPAKGSDREKTATAKKKDTAPKAAAPKTVTHTVKSGESLYVIAKKYGVTVDDIKKANSLKNDVLQPGASLKIPGAKGSATPAVKSTGKKRSVSGKSGAKKSGTRRSGKKKRR